MRDDYIIEILGIQMYNKDLDTFVDHALEIISGDKPRENRCISATGAHGIIHAKKNETFRETLNSFYSNLPDGMPGVWVGRGKGAKDMKRCYGPDLFAKFMQDSVNSDAGHFFVAGKRVLQTSSKKSVAKNSGI